ncbi:MAG: hypothetical protein AAFQ98_06300, partial [Bacteroidota bacterium]
NESGKKEEVFNLIENPRERDSAVIQSDSLVEVMSKRLHRWYGDILQSNSFTMPVFQIGYEDRKFNQVFAYAPIETGPNIMNGNLFSANWQKVGDFARYQINVETPGSYEVFLIHQIVDFEDLTFKASTGRLQTEASLTDSGNREFGTILEGESAYWDQVDDITSFRKEIIKSSLGTLPLNSEDHLLTIELSALADRHQGHIMDQLISVQLIKVD